MGMSTHAVGYKKADQKWNQMKKIWDDCDNAGISLPKEVLDFFGGEYPGNSPGMEISLGNACQKWSDDYRQGYEVSIDDLPKDVKYIRFYNSW